MPITIHVWLYNKSSPTRCRIYASMNWISVGSINGLSPFRREAITWTSAGLFKIWPLATTSVKFESKHRFFFINCIPKCHLRNSDHFLRVRWLNHESLNCLCPIFGSRAPVCLCMLLHSAAVSAYHQQRCRMQWYDCLEIASYHWFRIFPVGRLSPFWMVSEALLCVAHSPVSTHSGRLTHTRASRMSLVRIMTCHPLDVKLLWRTIFIYKINFIRLQIGGNFISASMSW